MKAWKEELKETELGTHALVKKTGNVMAKQLGEEMGNRETILLLTPQAD